MNRQLQHEGDLRHPILISSSREEGTAPSTWLHVEKRQ